MIQHANPSANSLFQVQVSVSRTSRIRGVQRAKEGIEVQGGRQLLFALRWLLIASCT
jgi:ribosomal protein S7